ncbi:shikimate kinase [Flavobacterium sp.]|uniref:shikimate kinase n=1 Tax=Flavobacterium sp. TaxID=239 RepID=UPI002603473D|nr:shikimate kinase [Flavobacterium sp.]MDD3003902.1 shikimate kinase [Flavobacterium sp.]
MKKILLTGYMGSGKSIIGKLLAQKLAINHYDLDDLIEKRLETSVSEIFKQKGEIFFRKTEHAILNEIIHSEETFVLSLGGGTPCYANNHLALLDKKVTSFYLNASITTLSSRLAEEKAHRPLIAHLNEDELKEYIAKHLFDRSYFYNQANYTIKIDAKSSDDIVKEILSLLT